MRKFAIALAALAMFLTMTAPALAWHVRVRPAIVLRVPALVVRPLPVMVQPTPVVYVRPAPVCPRGWHWNDYRDRCLPNY